MKPKQIAIQEPLILRSTKDFHPRESWWIGQSREAFSLRVKQEQDRMSHSTFGQVKKQAHAHDAE